MSHAKQPSKRKRRSKALPVLGAAGLSLSLASGASAIPGGPGADMPTRNTGNGHDIALGEEEISDVTLATFYVFDKENDGTSRPSVQLVGHGCGGCHGCHGGHGCGGCGGGHHGCGCHGCHGCGGCHHGCGGCVGFWFGGCGGCGGCGGYSGGYWCWINGVRTWCPYDYGY
jgi:hypothetical protein